MRSALWCSRPLLLIRSPQPPSKAAPCTSLSSASLSSSSLQTGRLMPRGTATFQDTWQEAGSQDMNTALPGPARPNSHLQTQGARSWPRRGNVSAGQVRGEPSARLAPVPEGSNLPKSTQAQDPPAEPPHKAPNQQWGPPAPLPPLTLSAFCSRCPSNPSEHEPRTLPHASSPAQPTSITWLSPHLSLLELGRVLPAAPGPGPGL